MRSTSNGDTTLYYKDKPFFAQPDTLNRLYKKAKNELTAGPIRPLDAATPGLGVVRVVRTTITKHVVLSDTSTIQIIVAILPCAFGCPAGLLYPALIPSTSDQSLDGIIQVFEVNAAELDKRLVSVPGRTDPYFNTDGLRPTTQRDFTLQLHAEVGMLGPRGDADVMIEPLTQPLLNEIRVAISSPVRPSSSPAAATF